MFYKLPRGNAEPAKEQGECNRMPETEMHSLYVSIGSVPISKMTPFVPSAHFARFYLRFNWIDFGRCPFFVLSFLPSFLPSQSHFEIGGRSVERRNGKPAPSFAVDVDTPVYVGPARPRRRPRETAGEIRTAASHEILHFCGDDIIRFSVAESIE